MLRKYKQFLIGFLIASLIFSSITVFADITEIKAFLSDIKITLNGQVLELKDANGNKVTPIVSNGTTYLPVRALANVFGKEVSFNSATNTIEITDKAVVAVPPEIIPADLAPPVIEPAWKNHSANPVKDTILKISESFNSEGLLLTLSEITEKDNILRIHFYYENNTDKAILKYRTINAVSNDEKIKSDSRILHDFYTGKPLAYGYPENSKGKLFIDIIDYKEYEYIEITNNNIKWQMR